MKMLSKRVMNWASILEPATREQAERASAMSFIYPHIALMPDAHLGRRRVAILFNDSTMPDTSIE